VPYPDHYRDVLALVAKRPAASDPFELYCIAWPSHRLVGHGRPTPGVPDLLDSSPLLSGAAAEDADGRYRSWRCTGTPERSVSTHGQRQGREPGTSEICDAVVDWALDSKSSRAPG
jgi:hypothetical protein